ncbi:bifunctional nicotinamide-nucleotide adenylyltransferase/Nudix hydroxylase [Moraxella nasovis]|uniref:bifunctional nicotinamide-nucleotide adenylyltransferase/Nudix hydroxylase n=1 Tax=Moraxella nasovis TaxID=2904121 RepID=UPI001F615DC5|nr:bifunctional nicotinamide-nucleotide adenylyltransferase/Nudix hydroxylase [Moraxella nasovis]UNU74068.1 bifunctional nicotinamide-nucleotide adenylyltransferase/Nudix hydroxylase [Moraxella nasovis]
MPTFDHLIFIGRFEPFHHGHEFVVREALKHTDHVILLIGSANSPRTIKNPFNFDERQAMILKAFSDEISRKITCLPIDDTLYNDHKWLQNTRQAVASVTQAGDRIGVIGHQKDDSSYYLSLFPDWEFIALPSFEGLSATPLRQRYFGQGVIDERMPQSSQAFLADFISTPAYANLQAEYRHILAYQKAWEDAPYPPVFVTADMLVVQSGHILLVERGGDYGRGLWAMAGGFLDKDETLHECGLRELAEETSLHLDKSSFKHSHTFDAPDRSARGRTVTTVFYHELQGSSLPDVVGADDATQAFWLPLNKLDGKKMFEDHYSIITKMLGI